jgi:serine/threonine protein kinase
MTCPECGSSVADAEAFCPFCGINLQSAAIAPADDSMESTIMISPSEAEELAKVSAGAARSGGSADDPGVTSETGGTDSASETAPEESNDRVQPAPDNAEAADTSLDEVPVPSLLADFSKTEGNMIPSTSEYSAEELVGSVDKVGADPHPEKEETEQAAPAESTASESRYETGPGVPEVHAPGEISVTVEEPVFAAEALAVRTDEAFSQPDLPEPPEPAVFQQAADPGQVDSFEEPAETAEPEPVAEGIGKPADDLSQFDSFRSQSMFDSVRIMEPRIERSDDAETRLHPDSHRLNRSAAGEQAGSGNVDAEKAISSTSHNIGLGDTDGKRSSKLKPLSEGTVLNGRYEIIRKIGGGGMGAVYLASDNNLGGVLRAVKEMVQTHIEEEQQEKAINDFKRESMILSSLDHVSIPTIYDYFYDEKESRFYLVMKYISGGDLSSRLRSAQEGKLDERTVCEWAVQITDVLDYLHNQPSTIVYRDLKPSNIMIDGNSGRAMLIDFGIARSISQKEAKGVTAVGTMGYAPPELFSGNVEPRSDIYSLGSTMFHLLTGADPQSNPLLIFDFQKNPRPRQINPQLSDQIERLIMKAVQYNADQRFASAGEMRDALEDHLLKFKAGIVTYGVGEVPASVSLANQSVFCGFCGQRIVATDMFCAFCGAKQPIAQQGVHSEIYSQAGFTAKLVVEGTSELTAPAFSLQKDDNLLGRRDPMSNIFPEVDLSKYDPQTKISRRHARIWREGNNFLLEDLGSSNGTILSRSTAESFRIPPKQPQVLAAGDRIRLGDATLHFIVG